MKNEEPAERLKQKRKAKERRERSLTDPGAATRLAIVTTDTDAMSHRVTNQS